MSLISFNEQDLRKEEILFEREFICTNHKGSFSYSTVANLFTRSYHGFFAIPQPQFSADEHIMLSALDETLECNGIVYNLGNRQYPGKIHPKGYQFLTAFELSRGVKWQYNCNGLILSKELIFHPEEDRIFIHYHLLKADDTVKISLEPFFGFRRKGHLQHATALNEAPSHLENGLSFQLYPDFSPLIIQYNTSLNYRHEPLWFYNTEYLRELDRGYAFREDLFRPGDMTCEMHQGDDLIVTIGTKRLNPVNINKAISDAYNKLLPLNTKDDCLERAARQFIIRREGKTEIIAGFPWFGRWGRDTLIALPGLTLSRGDVATFEDVMSTLLSEMQHGLLPNVGHGDELEFNSVDAPLWIFWAMQEYEKKLGREKAAVWDKWGDKMIATLQAYREGTVHQIGMDDDGLINAGEEGYALTWMDAVINGYAVTPRIGKPVEINALWYNAVCFMLELAEAANDHAFIAEWKHLPPLIKKSFKQSFWSKEKGYLADILRGDEPDFSIRPNQVFALSLPYSIPAKTQAKSILSVVKKNLYTPKGLRTLSPDHPDYTGRYFGSQVCRDHAYHQGTVWPWLLGHFAEAWLKTYGESGKSFIRDVYDAFDDDMIEHGLASVSEVYDGDAPHKAGGTVSQAWSISELIRIKNMLR